MNLNKRQTLCQILINLVCFFLSGVYHLCLWACALSRQQTRRGPLNPGWTSVSTVVKGCTGRRGDWSLIGSACFAVKALRAIFTTFGTNPDQNRTQRQDIELPTINNVSMIVLSLPPISWLSPHQTPQDWDKLVFYYLLLLDSLRGLGGGDLRSIIVHWTSRTDLQIQRFNQRPSGRIRRGLPFFIGSITCYLSQTTSRVMQGGLVWQQWAAWTDDAEQWKQCVFLLGDSTLPLRRGESSGLATATSNGLTPRTSPVQIKKKKSWVLNTGLSLSIVEPRPKS